LDSRIKTLLNTLRDDPRFECALWWLCLWRLRGLYGDIWYAN